MVPFDVGILLGLPWRDDVGLNSKTQEAAHQRRREIAATGAADEAGIVIKGEQTRPSVLAQEMHHGFQCGLGVEIGMDLGIEQEGGPRIDKIADLHHVLSFAVRVGGNRGGIFEIHLHLLQWLTRLQRLAFALRGVQDAAQLAQNFPHRACGARDRDDGRAASLASRCK